MIMANNNDQIIKRDHVPTYFPNLAGIYFRCPICGKQYRIEEAVVIPINTKSEHVGTKISGRTVTRTYQDTYYHIRFCKSCAKKRIKKESLFTWSIMIIFIVLAILFFVINWNKIMGNGGIGNAIGLLFVLVIIGLFVMAVIGWIKHFLFDKSIDISQAAKGNALKNPLFK